MDNTYGLNKFQKGLLILHFIMITASAAVYALIKKQVMWEFWVIALIITILNALSIVFADELFRWSMVFKVDNPDNVEPHFLQICTRYISWVGLTIVAIVLIYLGIVPPDIFV